MYKLWRLTTGKFQEEVYRNRHRVTPTVTATLIFSFTTTGNMTQLDNALQSGALEFMPGAQTPMAANGKETIKSAWSRQTLLKHQFI